MSTRNSIHYSCYYSPYTLFVLSNRKTRTTLSPRSTFVYTFTRFFSYFELGLLGFFSLLKRLTWHIYRGSGKQSEPESFEASEDRKLNTQSGSIGFPFFILFSSLTFFFFIPVPLHHCLSPHSGRLSKKVCICIKNWLQLLAICLLWIEKKGKPAYVRRQLILFELSSLRFKCRYTLLLLSVFNCSAI